MNGLPEVSNRPALEFPWFPTRWQAILWRNWDLVPVCRIAHVLQTTEETLRREAEALGLDAASNADEIWLKRGYLTVIRENWHLCTYEQIQTLLGIDADRLAFLLKEDDFLWHKLGKIKPAVPDNRYRPLTDEQTVQTARIRERICAVEPALRRENAFGFVRHYTETPAQPVPVPASDRISTVYSYFALYGDPLADPSLDPFPDALLAEYAKMGVRGVWLQGILYQLIDFPFDPARSTGHEKRMRSLNDLIARAARYGIGVYLYLNEPRSMDEAFFRKWPQLRGEQENDFYALCTSRDEVKRYLEDGMRTLFEQAKGLAGFFTITMSENLTNCWSRLNRDRPLCPLCAKREPWEVVAEVNNLMARGAHAANPDAKAIAWSWAWPEEWADKVPALLTEGQIVQSVSESFLKTNVAGVPGVVQDYSISQVGPGDYSKKIWAAARACGLECCAKVQLNNSWEMSAVPYLPVFDKAAEHIRNLKEAGVRHLQMSWTLGGFPSPILRMANRMMGDDVTVGQFLREWLGDDLGETADEAQKRMSRAFGEFPFDIGTLYTAPQNYGPMAPFYPWKTGWKASMVGFPYDDLESWRAKYDEDVFERQFALLVDGWSAGVAVLGKCLGCSRDLDELYRMAAAALCHFRSTLHQIRFVRARDRWLDNQDAEARTEALSVIRSERENVLKMLRLRSEDDRIGYEASNHYYYTVHDLLEKLVNLDECERCLG